MPSCNRTDRGCNITLRESGQTSSESSATVIPENLHNGEKQMVRREVAELNCSLNQLYRQLPTLVHAGRVIRLCEATGNVPADKL